MRVILQKIVKSLFFYLAILFITPIVNAAPNNNKIPQRIIVLDWDLLEQILTLDVIPVGATEIAGYNQWVAHPIAPNSIEEVGMRAEPNLEKIASLKPDLILASSSQQDLLPVLQTIAPVMYLPNFSRQDNAALVALAHFNTLATLLGKEAIAQQN